MPKPKEKEDALYEEQARVFVRGWYDALDEVGGSLLENRGRNGSRQVELRIIGTYSAVAEALRRIEKEQHAAS